MRKDVYGWYLRTRLNKTVLERAKEGFRIKGDIINNEIVNVKIV